MAIARTHIAARAVASVILAASCAGAANAQFGGFLDSVTEELGVSDIGNQLSGRQETAPEPAQPFSPGQQGMTPHGYSAMFSTVRTDLNAGEFEAARVNYTDTSDDGLAGTFLSANDDFLANVEQGVMLLEEGRYDAAVEAFDLAEDNVDASEERERDGGLFGRIGSALGDASKFVARNLGVGGLAAYSEEDYERVLQINYLTLARLLRGDEAAYNVGRRGAIEQAVLRERFLERLAEAETRLEESDVEQDAGAQNQFYSQFDQFSSIAARVPNAYVNPLGDYVTGLIFEIDAAANPATLGNANQAYKNALDLVPQSEMLQEAYRATSGARPEDNRIIHILMGEGFAPTRNLMVYGLQHGDVDTMLEIPVLAPVPSRIDRFEAYVPNGPRIGVMDPIADIEAIMMRSQEDRLPITWTEVVIGAVRTNLQRDAVEGSEIGSLALGVVEGLQAPDMRSWSALPRRFHTGRLNVPAGFDQIEIRAIDVSGQVISTRTITLDSQAQHNVVYGRATDGGFTIRRAENVGFGQAL